MNTRTKTTGMIAAAAAAVALIAGCSNDDSGSGHSMDSMGSMSMTSSAAQSASSGTHNNADAMWVQMMIPHHQQAVEMAALAEGRTENAELLALAGQIKAAQDPEIVQMTGWLAEWGVPTMAADMSHADMGHGDGMMTAEQMTQLEQSSGADFDRAWLEMMIAHHQGAVDSSSAILTDGQSEQVQELAKKIIAGQQAEITQMKTMLGQ
ncbi:uncharacterized protein (DUF305 family) [Rhodococcus sp. OK611]|uniref:DUF305 domain-containing protein n=1 Tax=unclassified Rhodococcus (in: high G+C Gram-positive bacteria) TaxID=192944 RepID=UPI000BCB2D64|nr:MULTISPECIES: DUF305 domain-containing protein [unclassified Rhodococcus (in: high G+C Gram-positive bacteria)]PTR41188.1 uncharacterized protein (DUF305 family) [Rhodococcus sp. OK611]SNX92010.1 Uncharacterized conserved protein, DUF305 family [Rhodococcus sp. OK270]